MTGGQAGGSLRSGCGAAGGAEGQREPVAGQVIGTLFSFLPLPGAPDQGLQQQGAGAGAGLPP